MTVTKPTAIKRSIALTLVCLLLFACSTGQLRQASDEPTLADEVGLALKLKREGRYAEAAEAYLKAAAEADGPLRERLKLRAARAFLDANSVADAKRTLVGFNRTGLSADGLADADLIAARIAFEEGSTRDVLDLLAAPDDSWPASARGELHALRARAFSAQNDHVRSAREQAKALALLSPGSARDGAQTLLQAELLELDLNALNRLLNELPDSDPLRAYVVQALMEAGADPARQQAVINFDDSAQALLQQLGQGYAPPRRIAVILPFIGQYGQAAAAVRDGMLAAYYADSGERPRLRFYPVNENAQSSAEAYEQALVDGADWVVGPLHRGGVSAVAPLIKDGQNVLLLNEPDGNAALPASASKLALLPNDEVNQIAERLSETGRKRTLVLAPSGDVGSKSSDAFRARYAELGGSTELTVYQAEGVDQLTTLKGALGFAESERRRAEVERIIGMKVSFEPRIRDDLDAIFLIGRAQQARLIMAQLKLYATGGVPIVSTSQVYQGAGNSSLDTDLNSVQFTELPWLLGIETVGPSRAAIRAAMPQAAGAAGRLYALGIDAYRLLPYLAYLRNHPDQLFPGATGRMRVDAFGGFERRLGWAHFQGGVIRPISAGAEAE